MIPVLTSEEMREADRRTIEEVGLPGVVLMENAGAAVAAAVGRLWPRARRVVVLCGKGNNGGDGFVTARRLAALGPRVFLVGEREAVRGDARVHLEAFTRGGGEVVPLASAEEWRARALPEVRKAEVVVDAMLGTGLKAGAAGLVAQAIRDAEAARREAGFAVVAVDVPSGLCADGEAGAEPVLRATATVTFAAPKPAHVLPPGCELVGEMTVAEIGIPDKLLRSLARLHLLEPADVAAAFPGRRAEAHKGDFGHVLVVGGVLGKTGAAVLAAGAAGRSGDGLVSVATGPAALPIVAAAQAEVMTEPLPVDAEGGLATDAAGRILALMEARDALVLGPGLGQAASTRACVAELLRRCPRPLVVDADGLNVLAPLAPGAAEAWDRGRALVLTPHPGEMARLLGCATADVLARRLPAARELAAATGAVVVLKGRRTLVAAPDGTAAVNPTGNPGMATGGTGDVLAGMVGALLARGLPAFAAAAAAVFLHGRAGDLAAGAHAPESLLAGDVLATIGAAIASVRGRDD
jgi:NAD(P)H-hydrate epimerase